MVVSNKRQAWEFAIGINQIDGPWEPSDEFKELIEKEINGEITTEKIKEILREKYSKDEQRNKHK